MESNGLEATCSDQPTNDPNQVDKVISTTPAANQQVDPGSKVTIVVGKAVEKKKVPEIKLGTPLGQAQQTLQQAGFTNIQVNGPNDGNAVVIGQNPPANSEVDDPPATQITLTTVGGNGGNGGNNNGGNDNGGAIGGLPGFGD